MAARVFTRSIFTIHRSVFTTKRTLSPPYNSLSTTQSSSISSVSFFRQRPLFALGASLGHTSPTAAILGGFATQFIRWKTYVGSTNPIHRRPLHPLHSFVKEHWLVGMEKPEGDSTRDEIIDSYIKTLAQVVGRDAIIDSCIKTLAQVVGSEDEARMKMYTVHTEPSLVFGANVSEELACKIKELPKVRWVRPDIKLGIRKRDLNKDHTWIPREPGCDSQHWLVVMEEPKHNPTRDEIIDSYIKTLAQVVGSEDEARMKIYLVSTSFYFGFGAKFSEEFCDKIKELPGVVFVLPDLTCVRTRMSVDNRNSSAAKRTRTDGGRREDDWTCPSCGNVNFSFRTTCNMRTCTQSRPVDHNSKTAPKPMQAPIDVKSAPRCAPRREAQRGAYMELRSEQGAPLEESACFLCLGAKREAHEKRASLKH